MVGETADGRGQGKDLGDRIFLQEEVRIREQNNSDTLAEVAPKVSELFCSPNAQI